jgi:hypothetical protein
MNVYERSTSYKAYDTNAVHDTKMLRMICYTNETCKMHMYMRCPTQVQKRYTTPSSPRKRENVSWSKSFVRISASYFWVGTCIKSMFPFSTLSLRKWWHTSMYLVLEWSTRFLEKIMALVLSDMRVTWCTPHQSHSRYR